MKYVDLCTLSSGLVAGHPSEGSGVEEVVDVMFGHGMPKAQMESETICIHSPSKHQAEIGERISPQHSSVPYPQYKSLLPQGLYNGEKNKLGFDKNLGRLVDNSYPRFR